MLLKITAGEIWGDAHRRRSSYIWFRIYLFRRFIVPWGFITLLTLVC